MYYYNALVGNYVMESPTAPSNLTLKFKGQDYSSFEVLWLVKGAELGHYSRCNKKSFMESPITPSHLSLSDLEKLKLRSLSF